MYVARFLLVMGGCQRFAVLRFLVYFSCGFAVFANFSYGFVVLIVAYDLRFPTEIWCGFSVFGHFELRSAMENA